MNNHYVIHRFIFPRLVFQHINKFSNIFVEALKQNCFDFLLFLSYLFHELDCKVLFVNIEHYKHLFIFLVFSITLV